jgi:sugar phosphate isomerase/epimerase
MHTGGPFETIAAAAQAVAEIAEPNFSVMPEPANLLMAREKFTPDMFAPLCGRIGGVHVQTLEVRPDAKNALKLKDGTEVRYDRVEYADNRQTDFATFFEALRRVGFDGYVNELEPYPGKENLEETVAKAAQFLGRFVT